MARRISTRRAVIVSVIGWIVGLLIFFPILWTVLTSFKTELDAYAVPPKFLFFNWTLENYGEVQQRSDYLLHAYNSILLSVGSNIVGLIIAVPAAWAMAFSPTKRTKDVLMWMLSTKMMPAAGVFMAIYFLFQRFNLLDSRVRHRSGIDAVEPSDHHLDALYLLQGDPQRHP